MDPISQGLVGAALSQSRGSNKQLKIAGILGFLSGMAADLDVFIRSSEDPLLFLVYHRQFTHSLIFIPFGGLICALVLHKLFSRQHGISLKETWLFCTLGYATHALLDACTTYGTQLLWPFSDARIAWNIMSIIDPVYTLTLSALLLSAYISKQRKLAVIGLIWVVSYPLFGLIQRERAIDGAQRVAAERNHIPINLAAKPSFGNLLVWKTVYEVDNQYYVDAVRAGIDINVFSGDNVEKLNLGRDFPWVVAGSQQAADIDRFRWFSNGYIAKDPGNANRIIDIRYSMVPNEINALWSIELSRGADGDSHAIYKTNREASQANIDQFLRMIVNPL
jgi:inner membrane protein|tara:strand:+ start:12464 stop:13468 length:1005 start_codon:yes stop_codon:yes gene_type:complete